MRVTSQEIVAPYCEKYRAFPTQTLARLVYKENVSSFKNLEAARNAVKDVRGKNGDKSRNKYKKYAGLFDESDRTKTPFKLPDTWANERKVFTLPVGCNNIGLVADAQVPFQDNKAIEACYEYLKDKKINTLFINGDWIDWYGLSRFEKDPRRRDFNHEYHCVLQSLEHMRYNFPTQTIYYNLDANHEYRYGKYMSIKARELLSLELPEYTLGSLLRLQDLFNIIPLEGNSHCMMGELPVLHGHTIFVGQTSPVSTARTVFMKLDHSAVVSHCHQVNEYTKVGPLDGKLITCWTTGMLADTHCEYNPHSNNYSQGFSHITTERDGHYHMNNKRIYKGKVL